jgi:Fe-S oxidoreductase
MRRWLRGYRGFFREILNTGTMAALRLQVRTGALHVLRSLGPRRVEDPVALFLERYAADGVRLPDPAERPLALAAARCLACGLCSLECARVDGRPPLDPREAVLAGSRLEIDLARLGLESALAGGCGACRACEPLCPAKIPIAAVQARLAGPGAGPGTL